MQTQDVMDLAGLLSQPPQRWGWEYVDPGPRRRSPEASREPVWREPDHLDPVTPRPLIPAGSRMKAAALIVVLFVLGGVLGEAGGLFVFLGFVICALFVPWNWVIIALSTNWTGPLPMVLGQVSFRRQRAQKFAQHEADHHGWRERIAAFDWAEQERLRTADLWYPVNPRPDAQRIDVVGGTSAAWSALLAVAGAGYLAGGRPMLVVDMSEDDVAGPLSALARDRGVQAEHHTFPADLDSANLLDCLTGRQIAGLVAGMLDDMRAVPDPRLRLMDEDILQTAAEALTERPISVGRIVAALRILEQLPVPDGILGETETSQLYARVDDMRGEQKAAELQFVREALRQLIPHQQPGTVQETPSASMPWAPEGLWVIRTLDEDHRRRELFDQLLIQVLQLQVRRLAAHHEDAVIVLAGADHLTLTTLEQFSMNTARAGLTLVLMIRTLRDDLEKLIGGADSTTIIMRLGNGHAAAAAADFIGRGHRFVMTEMIDQHGTTDSVNHSTTTGSNSSHADTAGTSHGHTFNNWFGFDRSISFNSSTDSSRTVTVGESREFTRSTGRDITNTEGTTVSRVYDYTVEPTRIQSLQPMSFLLVEAARGERRVVAASCDPQVADMPRVAGGAFTAGQAHRTPHAPAAVDTGPGPAGGVPGSASWPPGPPPPPGPGPWKHRHESPWR